MKNFSFILVVFFACLVAVYFYYDKEKKVLTNQVREQAKGKFVKLSNGYVHYELSGPEKGKVVVMVHGAGSGYYAWDNNYYELVNAGFRVLRYDLYGRGLSDRPDVVYDLDLFNKQLEELVDSLHIKKPYDIVSVSMGAMVAIDQANKHPENIDKIVLTDPAALNNGKKHWTLKTPILGNLLMAVYWVPRAVDKQMAEFHNPSKVSEYAGKSHEHLQYKGLRRAMLSTWLNTCSKNMHKELEEMGKKKKDVLLLWGSHDPLTPVANSKLYIERVPHLKFYEIKNAGHLSNYEQPKEVNKILIDYLK